MNERQQFTADDLGVAPCFRLRFFLVTAAWNGGKGIGVSLEWNRAGRKRRPYLSVNLLGLHLQSGWLWDDVGGRTALAEDAFDVGGV